MSALLLYDKEYAPDPDKDAAKKNGRDWETLLGRTPVLVTINQSFQKIDIGDAGANLGDTLLIIHKSSITDLEERKIVKEAVDNNTSLRVLIISGDNHTEPFGDLPEVKRLYYRRAKVKPREQGVDYEFQSLFNRFYDHLEKTGESIWSLLEPPQLLEPLLPFGVLLDYYSELDSKPDTTAWLKAAADAVRAVTRSGDNGVDIEWKDLQSSEQAAIKKIAEFLEASSLDDNRARVARLLAESAHTLSVNQTEGNNEQFAKALHQAAISAVQTAWNELCAKNADEDKGAPCSEDDLRRLIQEAAAGFHVLAVGHL